MEEAVSDPGYILYKQFCRFSSAHIYILVQIFLLSLKIIETAISFWTAPYRVFIKNSLREACLQFSLNRFHATHRNLQPSTR